MTQTTLVRRFRLFACCLVLTAIAFVQQPGRIVTDTKLDLALDPGGFLGRALTMWDPEGAFGQLQNQAYGYLFPMGPFFLGGRLLQVDAWVVQRLWWALILCVAFLGVYRLAGALGIGTAWTAAVAGFAYALSPRMLTVIGPGSIEIWPAAVAPWVLLPLVLSVRAGRPRWYAALSALAVATVGGVNAAATFAVVPLAALFIVLGTTGRHRRSLMLWWPPLVLLGTMWWIVPLMLLGRYSPPFLDYIETATVTSLATNLLDTLRGTVNWLPYVDASATSGNQIITSPIIVANTMVVMVLGFVGLARRDLPHRAFLAVGLVGGLVLVAASHDGPASGVLADQVRDLLDGGLAPLRNTHKFELVVRLPLVLGLAHLLAVLTRDVTEGRSVSRFRGNAVGLAFTVLAVSAVVGASATAWTGSLANRGSFTEVPQYWEQTASWLDDHDEGTALLVPATGFGEYAWGRTADEPLQPLANSRWAVRNLIPLAPGSNIEMLDAVSEQLATGTGGDALLAALRRAGVSHLVVRNDIDRSKDVVDTELVYAAVRSMPGVSSVASFGPVVGGTPLLPTDDGPDVLVNDGWQSSHPAVEIFDVPGAHEATVQDAQTVPVVVGGARSLLTLDGLGVTDGSQSVLPQDVAAGQVPASYTLGDGARRQEAGFGTVNRNRSSSRALSERYTVSRPVHRYDEQVVAPWSTVPRLEGARRIDASSSQADVDVLPFTDLSAAPWGAFDDDPTTAWTASRLTGGQESWVEIELDAPTDIGRVGVTLGISSSATREVTVTTQDGPRTISAQGGARVEFDVGTVSRLRVSGVGSYDVPFSVSDVDWVGKAVSRPLALPEVPTSWGAPDRVVVDSGAGYVSGCLDVDEHLRCGDSKASSGEDGRLLDREVTLPAGTSAGTTYVPELHVTGLGTSQLDEIVQRERLISVSSSSRIVASPEASPTHVIDGSDATGWVAEADDADPTLTLRWVGQRTVSGLRVAVDEALPGTPPSQVRLDFTDGTSRTVRASTAGVSFSPVTADGVTIHLEPGRARTNAAYGGVLSPLPVGVSEIDLQGVDLLPGAPSTQPVTLPCGSGPLVRVDGRDWRTSVTGSPAAMISGDELSARVCGASAIALGAGAHRLTVRGNDAFRPTSLLLTRVGAPTNGTSSPVAVDDDSFQLPDTGSGPRLLATTHNTNPGWEGKGGGRTLDAQVANGWQQGWEVPADLQSVTQVFAPDTAYRAGLVLGGVGVLVLLGLVVVGWRRSPVGAVAADDAVEDTGGTGVVPTLVLLACLGLVVSPAGVVCAAAGAGAALLFGRRSSADVGWLAAVPLAVAGCWAVWRPWGSTGTWVGAETVPQLLVAVSMGVLVAGVRLTSRHR